MASNTQIKIRYGMILENCVAHALEAAGIEFDRTPQYEDVSEVPDFLIPNTSDPQIVVECHQLGARNSMMMKTLRVLIAVAEAKRRFGPDLIALSVVFGNLSRDFASSPVKALCAAFDDSVLLQADPTHKSAVQALEAAAMVYARYVNIGTEAAAAKVVKEVPEGVRALKVQLAAKIKVAKLDSKMKSLWRLEATRPVPPVDPAKIPPPSYWKKAILQALFLGDETFDDLLKNHSSKLEGATIKQLVAVGAATVIEEIDGDVLQLDPALKSLLVRKDAIDLRGAARGHLEASRAMGHFFGDIRDVSRRERMAVAFANAVSAGPKHFERELIACAKNEEFADVEHSRCWFADLLSLCSGKSFNHFNNLIFQDKSYPITLWCPFSHLVLRTVSFVANDDAMKPTVRIAVDEFFRILKSDPDSRARCFVPWLSNAILNFRIENAIKLRKVSPLVAVADEVCARLGLRLERESVENLLFDVASDAGVGRFLVYVITDPTTGARGLFNAVAGYENPTDKAKEWAARCLALRYRVRTDTAVAADWKATVFLIDGAWSQKDIFRLRRGGWQEIVGLDELEDALRRSFGIKGTREKIKKTKPIMWIDDDDLPMAAED